MPFLKHQHCQYVTPSGLTVAAIVKRAHRDGTATVEARFFLDRDGEARPGYLGYKYRIAQSDLLPTGATHDPFPSQHWHGG